MDTHINKLRFSCLRYRWPYPILAIMFRPFGYIAPKTLNYYGFPIFDEGYSALNFISTFLLTIKRLYNDLCIQLYFSYKIV